MSRGLFTAARGHSPRASGVLLHPTSLPGPFGIGDLGPQARQFVDFLHSTAQSVWQVLPLGPTGYGNSPYMCFSAFAGNPLLVSPEQLVVEGLLDEGDILDRPSFPADRVDYAAVARFKQQLLRNSHQRFWARARHGQTDDFYDFCQRNAFWLEDYALFMALKQVHGGAMWTQWETGASRHDLEALVGWCNRLTEDIQYQKYVQYTFFTQWSALAEYAHGKGVSIIGDVPIYVAFDSADVWANRHLFYLDGDGQPLVVAGVPPDYFSATGQRWGNPLYRWEAIADHDYRWWIERLRMSLMLVDVVRLDHFRGFEAYWEVPASEPTAINGRWVKGPGAALFEAVRQGLAELDLDLQVIAEDLGVITPEVDALRETCGFPGMRILQMAFGDDPKASEYRPHNHVRNSVAYTATHDHNTTVGWFTATPGTASIQTDEQVRREREYALRYTGGDGREIQWSFIRLALGSVAELAVFPLQDLLGLGGEARMNRPGTGAGNWEWRYRAEMLTEPLTRRLFDLTRVYERDPRRGV